MRDFYICILLFIYLVFIMYALGNSIVKNDNTSYKFVTGYIVYEFLIALGGLPIQLLNLQYSLFLIWVFIVNALVITFVLIKIFIFKNKLFPDGVGNFLKNNFILIIIMILLMVTALVFLDFYWDGNCQDDGFYINKMATLPYINNPFKTSPATGLATYGFSTYNLNVGEMESSVYIYLLNINVGIYARVFLAAFQYFVFLSTLCACGKLICEEKNWNFDKALIQFVTLVVLIFAGEYHYLTGNSILAVQDSWQFNSAMYYGSSIVRTSGILMLIMPFLKYDKLSIKSFLIFGIISVFLISKSTVALPIIFISGCSYLMSHLLIESKKKRKLYVILIIALLLIASLLVGNNAEINKSILETISRNLNYDLLKISIVGFLLGFLLKSKEVYKLNISIIIMVLLMTISPLNNLFEKFAVYNFVAGRALTNLIYTIIFLGFLYLSIFIFRIIKNKYIISIIYIIIGIYLFNFQITAYESYYGNIEKSYEILSENKYFVPNSTIVLGNYLQGLYEDSGEDINVLVQEQVTLNGYGHALASLIRSYAPNIKVITAINRYGVVKGNPFSTITSDDIDVFNQFMAYPSNETFKKFKKLINDYPINCVIFTGVDKTRYMEKLGFSLVKIIEEDDFNYYIYYNSDVDTNVKVDKDYGYDNYSDIFENAYIKPDSTPGSQSQVKPEISNKEDLNQETDDKNIDTSDKLEDNKDDEEKKEEVDPTPSPTPTSTPSPSPSPSPTPNESTDSSDQNNNESADTTKTEGES